MVLHVSRSAAFSVVTGGSNGVTGRISGLATVEEVDDGKFLILRDGIKTGRAKLVTYEHPVGVFNTIGQLVKLERSQTHDDKKALKFEADLYLKRPMGKEIYETAEVMKEAGDVVQLSVSIEGDSYESQVERRGDGIIVVKEMDMTGLVVTAIPQNRRALWSTGNDWVPIAASMMAQHGEDAFVKVLRAVAKGETITITASGIGYPTQGMGSESAPGSELAPLVPQSLGNRVDATNRAPQRDDYIVTLLRDYYPQLTWDQGAQAVQAIIDRLNRQVG